MRRKTFKTSDRTVVTFKHPYLAGQISSNLEATEINVSRAGLLNELWLANQATNALGDITIIVRDTEAKLELIGIDLNRMQIDNIPLSLLLQEAEQAAKRKEAN